jgi:curved DNA-binding protein
MAVGIRDYYETLGVARDASDEQIRRAYRKLAREYHPDVNEQAGAEDRFKEISEAYEVLRDPDRRARYDRAGAGWASGDDFPGGQADAAGDFGDFGDLGGVRVDFGDGEDLGDLFESLFGERRGRGGFGGFQGFATQGADHEAVLELSLEDAAAGGQRQLTLSDGRTYDVTIPAGVRDGQRIRLPGEGGAGAGGGPAGDLLLRVRIKPHPRFRLDGRDLHVELPVAPWEAALGATVEVPTLEGSANVRVPAGSSSGRRLRLRGRGFPGPRGGHGDLYATVRIVVPKHLGERERRLFEQLARVSGFQPRTTTESKHPRR